MRSLKSFLPTADDVLKLPLSDLGGIVLAQLKSCEGTSPIYQHAGGINREYFFAMMEHRNVGLGPLPDNGPEYANRQPEVARAVREAWNWLEREGHLIHTTGQPSPDWFSFSRSGEALLSRNAAFERYEQLGVDRVKYDLLNGGFRVVGGPAETQEEAWEWVRIKENKPPIKRIATGEWVLIDDGRLLELRALVSPSFDFKKLIRLCEELNVASREDCYFAIGMLTRALLDHVPPLFGVNNFGQVANNYSGGSRSFKDAMFHLDTAAKKIGDGFLHTQIRKSETLPNRQQVNCSAALDVLLGEIVRIML